VGGLKSTQSSRTKSLPAEQAKRLGMGFGVCQLSLQRLRDPVASLSGHVYSKEAILSYILSKKREIKALESELMEKEKERTLKERVAKKETELRKEQEVRDLQESGPDVQVEVSAAKGEMKRKRMHQLEVEAHKKRKRIDFTSTEAKMQQLAKSSPWLSRVGPDQHEPKGGDTPVKTATMRRPLSPNSGRPLKLKDLTPFTFETDPGDPSSFICSVSGKEIKFQPAVLLKTCSKVILKSVFDEFVQAKKICPISSKPLRKKDILFLQTAATTNTS